LREWVAAFRCLLLGLIMLVLTALSFHPIVDRDAQNRKGRETRTNQRAKQEKRTEVQRLTFPGSLSGLQKIPFTDDVRNAMFDNGIEAQEGLSEDKQHTAQKEKNLCARAGSLDLFLSTIVQGTKRKICRERFALAS